MSRVPKKVRAHGPWFAIILVAAALLALVDFLIPDILNPLVYATSMVLAALASPIMAGLLPASLRGGMSRSARRVRQFIVDPDTDLSYTVRYAIDPPVSVDEINDDLKSQFGASPIAGELYKFTRARPVGEIDVKISLETEVVQAENQFNRPASMPTGADDNSVADFDSKTEVTGARLEMSAQNIDYNDFEEATDAFQALESTVTREIIRNGGRQKSGIGFNVEFVDEDVLQSLIPGISQRKATIDTEEDLEVTLHNKELHIEDPHDVGPERVFQTAREFLLFYGEPRA